jgi:hypothetical protein
LFSNRSLAGLLFLAAILLSTRAELLTLQSSPNPPASYLGFDRNDYPGDSALPALKQSFAFTGYWLNAPPGSKSNTWAGKRAIVRENGFGFLVLFNGRTSRQLKRPADPAALGVSDARAVVESAQREGFSPGAVIFLDQEEGGRLLLEQRDYLFAWVDAIIAAGFRAGVYCSGIAVKEGRGQTIVTADDIHEHAGGRQIAFFIYNDVCPPSPGCAISNAAPLPSASGISFADAWQFAQSPRRHDFARGCPANYNPDGNCYPPVSTGTGAAAILLDLDSAASADPSGGR